MYETLIDVEGLARVLNEDNGVVLADCRFSPIATTETLQVVCSCVIMSSSPILTR